MFKKLLSLLVFLFFFFFLSLKRDLFFEEVFVVTEWDSLYSAFSEQSDSSLFFLKIYSYLQGKRRQSLQVWSYSSIVWKISKSDFFSLLKQWPSRDYRVVKLLEWWSRYDVDNYLFDRWFIERKGNYIDRTAQVSDYFVSRFDRLSLLPEQKSLEGFLYPDTYHVDSQWDFLRNLLSMQLTAFEDKVVQSYDVFSSKKKTSVLWERLSAYELINLASIVEKEERVDSQRKDIAWVFYNRIKNDMRFDADITLCYGLKRGYDQCSPSVIVQHLYDRSNLYNTRQLWGFPPTPIVTPTVSSVDAVLSPRRHDKLYYLHDPQWRLHMSSTINQHNDKKKRHL